MTLPKQDYPIFTVTLPTTKEKIKCRPFLVKEEKILLMSATTDDQRNHINALEQVINNCILDENFELEKLSLYDFIYIFLALRSHSVGEVVEIQVNCPKCNESNDYSFNIIELLENFNVDYPKTVQYSEKYGVTMQFPRYKLLSKINTENPDIDDEILILLDCIENIYSKDEVFDMDSETLEEKKAWLESLRSDQVQKIGDWIKNAPKLKHEINIKCKKCGHEIHKILENISDFFT